MPKVSVLIPTYNRADYLVRAIESVRLQTFSDWEIIVVDDGSTDNTWDVVNLLPVPIQYVYQTNHGVSSARNRAFGVSSGEYILMLDSDDVLLPEALEKLSIVLDSQPDVDLVHGDGWVCNVEGKVTGRWSEYWQTPFESFLENVVVCNSLPIIRTALVRRHLLAKAGGLFDEEMIGYEDWDLAVRLVAVGCRVSRITEPVCMYQIHEGSKSLPTSKWAERRRQSLIRSRLKVLENSWFDAMSRSARYRFFFDFLSGPLRGDYTFQEQVLAHHSFGQLPAKERSQLLYRLAVNNSLGDTGGGREFRHLLDAIRLHPQNPRPYFLLVLSLFGSSVRRSVLRAWRRVRSRPEGPDPITKGPRSKNAA